MAREPLEREPLLSTASALLSRAREGAGGMLVIEGPAGIGKSTVLDRIARGADIRTAWARPVELERAFAFGVVRTLFASFLGGLGSVEVTRLCRHGPGAGARRVLDDGGGAPAVT